MALGLVEWAMVVLPWLIVLFALLLHWRDENEGYPERMRKIEEVD